MTDVARSITSAFDQVWTRFLDRLAGLDDDEYLWEPVQGCWSLRPGPDGRWTIDGEGGDGGPASAPDPPPVTTVAWRAGHIGLSFIGFGDRLFRDGTVTLNDVTFASSATAVAGWLDTTYLAWWRSPLGELGPQAWGRSIGPAFGPFAEQSTTDLALHVLDELTHHAAEIGLLRDLYRRRDELGRR